MFTLLKIGDKDLKLRLNSKNIVALEKSIGKNPTEIIICLERGIMPKVSDVILILHYSLQALEHGYTIDKVYDLYDEYMAEGNTIIDLINVLNDVFIQSGLIPGESKKN